MASYDHSVVAEAVLEQALDLARVRPAETELFVVEVLDDGTRFPIDEYGGPETQRRLGEYWLQYCVSEQRWDWGCRTGKEPKRPHLEVRFGSPVEEIVTFANEVEASLVIVGRHPKSSRWFGRSTIQQLVPVVRCPLLVVQTGKERDCSGFSWVAHS